MKRLQKLTDGQVDPYFKEWAVLRERILTSHQLRDRSSEAPMLRAIQVFHQLLLQCEGLVSPINYAERLQFVEQHPTRFAAYRQLDELFVEMKKSFVSKRIQSKHFKS